MPGRSSAPPSLAFPRLGSSPTAFTEWMGAPISSGALGGHTLNRYKADSDRLSVLFWGQRAVVIHCRYSSFPPSWSRMEDDAHHYLPIEKVRRGAFAVHDLILLPASNGYGWTLARQDIGLSLLSSVADDSTY